MTDFDEIYDVIGHFRGLGFSGELFQGLCKGFFLSKISVFSVNKKLTYARQKCHVKLLSVQLYLLRAFHATSNTQEKLPKLAINMAQRSPSQ